MENLDLNLENYSFQDLLDLYKITRLDEKSLKQCYKTTMMTHPDKSRLDKSIFLFFVKAFKLLHQVYDIHTQQSQKTTSCTSTQEYQKIYQSQLHDFENEHSSIITKLKERAEAEDFNQWFNKAFDKLENYDKDIENGYDDWFRSQQPDDDHTEATNMTDMHSKIQARKNHLRQLTVYRDPETIDSGGYNIVREPPTHYSSTLFSKLQYEDLKRAHTETVVPVTNNDIRRSFRSTDDYTTHRNNELNNYRLQDSLAEHTKQVEQENLQNTYRLSQQMERTKEIQKQWWSSLRQIEY